MSLKTGHFYEFGNFRLDPAGRVLFRDGDPVALTPKAFHLLTILVKNHGNIVEKEKLIGEIWANSFVEDGNLAVNARMLRKALDDDAGSPRFIETVPRRGYRFIAPTKEIFPSVTAPSKSGQGLRPNSRSGSVLLIWAVLGFGVIAGAVWFAGTRMNRSSTAPILSAPFSSSRFSTSGTVSNAVISPDGFYAAFIDTSGGSHSLWLRKLDSGENIQIVPPSADHYFGLTFSNDGRFIYFARKPADIHLLTAIYRVAAFGGIPVKILDDALGWISLSPDDMKISFVRCRFRPDDNCSLYIVDADGSNERKVLSRPAPILVESNQFSPNGRSIAVAYGEYMTGISDNRIAIVDIESGAETEVLSKRFFDIKSLQWLPKGDELMFTVRDFEDGRVSIWKTPIAGGDPAIITQDAASYQDLSLDKKAERMIATQVENDFQIYLGSGSDAKPVASGRDLAVSADGRIVYSTFDGEIWSISLAGGDRRQLTTGPWGDHSPRVSLDGRSVFIKSNRSGETAIWKMNSDGTGLIQISPATGGIPCGSTADGQWIYYSKNRRLHRVSVNGGDDAPVSPTKVLRSVCSPDGSRAAYFFLDGRFKIGVMNTTSGEIEKVLEYGPGKTLPQRIAWSPDSRTLNFIVNTEGRNILWQQALDETAARMVADLGGDEIRDLAILPDGRSFAFVRGKWINDAVLITGLK